MKTIEMDQLILFHRKIIQASGGSDGIRDITLIERALNKASATK
jgi:death on curing protein